MDQGKHHFLFSCKANYLFKQHTLPHVKVKGDSAWTSSKKRLLVYSYIDKKPLNMITNDNKRPLATREFKDGRAVPNIIAGYCSTLGYINQVNFHTTFMISVVNSWLLYTHVNKDKKGVTYCTYLRLLLEALVKVGGRLYRKRKRQAADSPFEPSPTPAQLRRHIGPDAAAAAANAAGAATAAGVETAASAATEASAATAAGVATAAGAETAASAATGAGAVTEAGAATGAGAVTEAGAATGAGAVTEAGAATGAGAVTEAGAATGAGAATEGGAATGAVRRQQPV
ncbi:uncharacterized protein ACA1_320080 [Acanthamoeba castellanii str. Neff]|uniref:Uncharacterized protein n=1 Tax=Acanthamoeba castellanii (strain ATCC 30010 / Neff) TaxID=1257118 RepID=L8H426_ACACF|nr:uncharacterized protein ACA1_320080 [Acanthamoeba castellanii str. Neff]ELR20274.1 hypothetical protein ACA1_320080 [Acanthamoeba castellanii str. Neff]